MEECQYYLIKKDSRKFLKVRNDDSVELPVERFYFDFKIRGWNGPWFDAFPFIIIIGKKKFSSTLSDPAENLLSIRKSLIYYVFSGETNVKLQFKESSTIIRMKKWTVLDETSGSHADTSETQTNIIKISVIPDKFSGQDSRIEGYSEECQVIRQLYESSLDGTWHINIYKNINDKYKEFLWLRIYNRIKSYRIEDYISGKNYDIEEANGHHKRISEILLILPSCWDCLHHGIDLIPNEGDTFEWYKEDGTVLYITVPGLDSWYIKFLEDSGGYGCCNLTNMHLNAWHREGLRLAAEVRKQLPRDIDLYYCYPYEDKKHRGKRSELIY